MNKPSAAVSAGLHIAGIMFLLLMPASRRTADESFTNRFRESARLVAPPPPVLTQRPPNRIQPPKAVNLEGLLAKRSAVAAPKPVPREPEPVPPAPPALPPQTQTAAPVTPTEMPPPPPVPKPEKREEEKPKLAFENPHGSSLPSDRAPSGILRQPGQAPAIRLPGSSLEDAIQEVARNRRGAGQTVGGEMPEDVGGILETRTLNRPAMQSASTVELLSDPKGVDFKPYLTLVLSAVRRNWRAVFPESARLGRRGKVVILFSIDRTGRIPKLVISETSGAEPLDRAAVAGVSASDPFPPLPTEFLGEEVRLQLNFMYNMRQ